MAFVDPNPEYYKRLLSFDDLNPKKKVHVPVYIDLQKLLYENMGAAQSTGGQLFAFVPTTGHNSFCVPIDSKYIKSWLTERRTAIDCPPPNCHQLREAIRSFESNVIAGSSSNARVQMYVRTAWSPHYFTPKPLKDQYDKIIGYHHFNSPSQPAMIFSLDTRRGLHAAITPDGWSLQPSNTPFVHDPIQQPLPEPTQTKSPETPLASFRKLLRLDGPQHESSWKSLLDWTLHAMRPAKNVNFHDYPILNLHGPANSGKTVASNLLAQLIDPTGTPVHSIPTTERKLHGLAASHHVLVFDSPGKINPEKSLNLSRLSTGVASTHKQLEGTLVRPIILTTRKQTETRHLSGRIVDVEFPVVDNPVSQQELWEEFEKLRPEILGALLTLLSQTFDAKPANLCNRKTKRQKIEESIPLLIKEAAGRWQGTATDLKKALPFEVTPKALGQYLKEAIEKKSLNVTRKKNNGTITLYLSIPNATGTPEEKEKPSKF